MNRRDALSAIAALGAIAGPFQLRSQPRTASRPFRIGMGTGSPTNPLFRAAFKDQMRERGWLEDQDYIIVSRSKGLPDLGRIADEISWILGENLDLLLVSSTAGAVEAHRLTKTLPIVMLGSGYPVEAGVANSLARPGKNVTGNSIYAGSGVWGKLLQLLRDSKPGINRVGLLWGYVSPAFPAAEIEPLYKELEQGARSLGLSIHIKEVPTRDKLPSAMAELAADRPDALFISGWLTAGDGWSKVVEFTTDKKLPTISDFDIPWSGQSPRPLLIYSPDIADLWRQTISYVDRILRGAKPGDLPIQLPSRFQLTVNLQTAKAIGLKVPQVILLRADKVVE